MLLGLGVATAVVPTTVLFLGVNLLFFVPLVVGVLVFCLGLRTSNASKLVSPVIVLVVCAWIGPFLLTIYLSRPGPPIEFIVPSDFRGKIEVIRDRNKGEDLKFEQGRCVFVIPPSGVIRVKEAYPFHRWHSESCRDEDGKKMHLEGKGATTGNRRTGPNSSEGSTDFDGTTYRWEVR